MIELTADELEALASFNHDRASAYRVTVEDPTASTSVREMAALLCDWRTARARHFTGEAARTDQVEADAARALAEA